MSRSHRVSRREALKALGATATVATVASACGIDGGSTDADTSADTDTPPDPKSRLKTVVILMMENRSFDHYFGSLSLEGGREDVNGLAAGMSNPDSEGNDHAPYRLDVNCIADPSHSWGGSHAQFNGGANDGFVKQYEGRNADVGEVMGYYNGQDLPIFYGLLAGASLCDTWFCSVMGPTWPNRFYSMCGTSLGCTQTSDFSYVPFAAKSIFAQIEEAGIEWRAYVHDLPFTMLLGDVDRSRIASIDQFFADAATGDLPPFVWIEPAYSAADDHPPHPMVLGQALIGTVYQALAESPQWEECALIIDYDEHGGFFDHVAPPTTQDDLADQGFDQLGFRIPGLVAGPWVKPGVCHTQFDHTSVLKTVQDLFGLEPLTKRNAAANAMWDCFDLDRMAANQPSAPVKLPTMDVDPANFGSECFSLITPNQPELWEAADRGLIPPSCDFRSTIDQTLDRMLARAAKMGIIRFVSGPDHGKY